MSRTSPGGPRCRSTRSASTRSGACCRRPSREGRVAWYGPEHLDRLARIRELQGRGPHPRADRAAARRARSTPPTCRSPPRSRRRGRRRRTRGVPRPARARRRVPGFRSRSSKPSPAKDCSCRASTTARSATRPPTSRSCNRVWRCSSAACRCPSSSRSRAITLRRRATSPSRRSRCSTSTCGNRCGRPSSPTTRRPSSSSPRSACCCPTITTLVAHHFRRVLLAVAQEHLERVGEDTELAAVSEAAASRLEEGFLS